MACWKAALTCGRRSCSIDLLECLQVLWNFLSSISEIVIDFLELLASVFLIGKAYKSSSYGQDTIRLQSSWKYLKKWFYFNSSTETFQTQCAKVAGTIYKAGSCQVHDSKCRSSRKQVAVARSASKLLVSTGAFQTQCAEVGLR